MTLLTTALAPQSACIGVGNLPTAKALAASNTLSGSPAVTMALLSGFTAGALPSTSPALIDVEGSITILPGGWVAIYTLTATIGFFSFTWIETPIAGL